VLGLEVFRLHAITGTEAATQLLRYADSGSINIWMAVATLIIQNRRFIMQTGIIKGLAVSALTLGLLAAVQTASAAPLGIANTKHNLGTGGLALTGANGARVGGGTGLGDIFTTGTSEICVFCHTPHGSNSGANGTVPVPLWNKGTLPSTVYTVFRSGTMNGTAPANLAGHMSLACLSCHDGTQAMDNMINQPGSGGYNASGARLPGTWYNVDGPSEGSDTLSGALNAGPGGAGVFALGTDLSNDHPIGMPYGGGNCAIGAVNHDGSASCADHDFNNPQAGLNGFYQVGSTTPGDKTAMRLYNTAAGDIANATVECASCHDPHSDAQATFLRVSNSGSGVCLTCHAK